MTPTKTPCDLLLSAPWVLPVAPRNEALVEHAIAVADGKILGLGPTAQLQSRFEPARHETLDQHILLPGLVNAHGHAAMTLLRGAGEDQALQSWLADTIWPLENAHVDAEFVALGTELAIAEMLCSGTTLFSDMYFFPEIAARAADRSGINAQIAVPIIEQPNAWTAGLDACFHRGLGLYDDFRHHDRVHIAFGPHSTYALSHAGLARMNMYVNELEACVQIHLHENAQEVEDAQRTHGCTPIATLAQLDMLGPHLQAVHMTCVSDADLELIANSSTAVIHCPASNLKLASGYCDITRLTDAGVTLGLGTDGAASNNTLDMFAEAHLAALLAKHQRGDPRAGRAQDILAQATLGGATALNRSVHHGSLEVGKQADIIAIDMHSLGLAPVHDPFAALIHGNAGGAVSRVWVAGELLVEDGRPTRIDQQELLRRAQVWAQHLHGN